MGVCSLKILVCVRVLCYGLCLLTFGAYHSDYVLEFSPIMACLVTRFSPGSPVLQFIASLLAVEFCLSRFQPEHPIVQF